MDFGVPDRIGVFDWHWAATVERWKAELESSVVNEIESCLAASMQRHAYT